MAPLILQYRVASLDNSLLFEYRRLKSQPTTVNTLCWKPFPLVHDLGCIQIQPLFYTIIYMGDIPEETPDIQTNAGLGSVITDTQTRV